MFFFAEGLYSVRAVEAVLLVCSWKNIITAENKQDLVQFISESTKGVPSVPNLIPHLLKKYPNSKINCFLADEKKKLPNTFKSSSAEQPVNRK